MTTTITVKLTAPMLLYVSRQPLRVALVVKEVPSVVEAGGGCAKVRGLVACLGIHQVHNCVGTTLLVLPERIRPRKQRDKQYGCYGAQSAHAAR